MCYNLITERKTLKKKEEVNKMKEELLEYLKERLERLAEMKYDANLSDHYRKMASGAWSEAKTIYLFVQKMEG